MPPTQTLCSRTKKSTKMRFFSSQGEVKLPDQRIKSCKIVSAFFFIFMSHVTNQPSTQTLGPRAKKAQKCVFFIAGLSKITRPKNKKLRNSNSFLFYIHVTCEKSTTYAKFENNSENGQENF